jgi:hypothetical protein
MHRSGGFGDACAACVDELASCSGRQCAVQCIQTLTGANASEGCRECSDASCYEAFYKCSGLQRKRG